MPRLRPWPAVGVLVAVVVVSVLVVLMVQRDNERTALGSGSTPAPATATPATVAFTTSEYLPGVEADLYLPPDRAVGTTPVVVMVPGGGWRTADRTGMGQLAQALASGGAAVVSATYRVGEGQPLFPRPVQDITCAVDAGVAAVVDAGLNPGPVVLVGHSAGAHLSSLAALDPDGFRGDDCPHPPTVPDGWVGLSGVFDLTAVGEAPHAMMGGSRTQVPDAYTAAATESHLAPAPGPHLLDVLVVQGDADELGISVGYATDFAADLRAHGYPTRLEIVPGDHAATYQAPVVAGLVLDWVAGVEQVDGAR